ARRPSYAGSQRGGPGAGADASAGDRGPEPRGRRPLTGDPAEPGITRGRSLRPDRGGTSGPVQGDERRGAEPRHPDVRGAGEAGASGAGGEGEGGFGLKDGEDREDGEDGEDGRFGLPPLSVLSVFSVFSVLQGTVVPRLPTNSR